jgi:hypothetical protein
MTNQLIGLGLLKFYQELHSSPIGALLLKLGAILPIKDMSARLAGGSDPGLADEWKQWRWMN